MLTEHNQLVVGGDAQRQVVRPQVDEEQKTCNWHLEEVVSHRDLVREETLSRKVLKGPKFRPDPHDGTEVQTISAIGSCLWYQ